MKKHFYNKRILGIALGGIFCIGTAMTATAGHWMANEVGYWYVHDDGTYPVYSWEWIDNDGDGIYQCYAFDENGYLYQNTVTPDGYYVGPDGAWYDMYQPVSRGFWHNASVVPTSIAGTAASGQEEMEYTYASDGTVIITKKYSSPKNEKNNTSSKKSSSSSKSSSSGTKTSSSSGSKTKTSTGVPYSEIVTSKIVTGGSSGDSSNSGSKKSSDYTEPNVDAVDYEDGDGPDVPSNYSSNRFSPITDESTINMAGPKNTGGTIERDGFEDEDDEDDEE